MPTLYVENVPADLYEAIRKQARENRTSIAAEVLAALKPHFPTAADLQRRRAACHKLLGLQARASLSPGPFPSAEEEIREIRDSR